MDSFISRGPVPFLPSRDVLVDALEGQWGALDKYRGISTSAAGTNDRQYRVWGLGFMV